MVLKLKKYGIFTLLAFSPLSLYSSLACDQQINNMFPSSEFAFRDQYYKKKYAFSAPKLEVEKLVLDLFPADTLKREQLMGFLKYEADKADAAAQEKLYLFLTKLIGTVNLVNLTQGQQLLEHALQQEQSWSFWQKGELEKTAQYPLTRWHFLAANRSYDPAVKHVKLHFKESWGASLVEIKKLATSKLKKDKENLILQVQLFVNTWNMIGYAQPIYELFLALSNFENHVELRDKTYLLAMRSAADLGCLDAQVIYLNYLGLKEDASNQELYLKYNLKAARQGSPEAMHNAATCLVEGIQGQMPADPQPALELWLTAADKGFQTAMYEAAVCFLDGFDGQPPDEKRALDLFLTAADKGDVDSMYNAGCLLSGEYEQPANEERAFSLLVQAANKGKVEALNHAALILNRSIDGTFPNRKKRVLDLYLKASDMGDLDGSHNAGLLLLDGFDGQPADEERARELFLQAANKNHTLSMIRLAVLHLNSYRKAKHLKRAIFWLEKAVLLHNSLAAEYLEVAGILAENEEDDSQLEKLLRKTGKLQKIFLIKSPTIIAAEPITTSSTTFTTAQHCVQPQVTDRVSTPLTIPEPIQEASSGSENNDDTRDIAIITNTKKNTKEITKEIKNIKVIRENLRELGKMAKATATQNTQNPALTLSKRAQMFADAILTRDTVAIDHNSLEDFFSDPFFQGQVNITPTKSGIAINAFNRLTHQHASAGTHRKHGQSYKGAQPEFVKSLKPILDLFGIKQSF